MDIEEIRRDFPFLRKRFDDRPVRYLDSACVTLTPRQVIAAMDHYYSEMGSCGGRSVHRFGTEVTRKCEGVREKIRRYIGAADRNEIVFTKNTTEAINLVANTFDLKKNDMVMTTDKEHNSNFIVWQDQREKRGIEYRPLESRSDNTFDLEQFEETMCDRVKLVSVYHTSNLDGSTLPIREITKIAHEHDAAVLVDAAQGAGHEEIDVRKLDIDLMAFSSHKMLGPSLGVLYGKREILESLPPFIVGGGSVVDSDHVGYRMADIPGKFEGGLQNYAAIMGVGAAIDYLERIGRRKTKKHEVRLNEYVTDELKDDERISIIGPASASGRGGIFSFNIGTMNPHDVALYLDNYANILVRSGMHCVHSWFNGRGIKGSIRASFYLYNNIEDAEVFVEAINRLLDMQ